VSGLSRIRQVFHCERHPRLQWQVGTRSTAIFQSGRCGLSGSMPKASLFFEDSAETVCKTDSQVEALRLRSPPPLDPIWSGDSRPTGRLGIPVPAILCSSQLSSTACVRVLSSVNCLLFGTHSHITYPLSEPGNSPARGPSPDSLCSCAVSAEYKSCLLNARIRWICVSVHNPFA